VVLDLFLKLHMEPYIIPCMRQLQEKISHQMSCWLLTQSKLWPMANK